ncbi:MAG: CHAP domain-containing protein [Oscillospiraceae bacterium]|nr:CHAP domain-containing protein [Oscillospiraceae bacterium]
MKIELGAIAETLAAKHIIGEKTNSDFLELLKYYPKNDADEFKNCWCCAFVYHCCRKAGVDLPLGTHKTARKGHFRWFTSVLTWFEWAQINGFIHKESPDYLPIRGDIVIYNNIIHDEYKQKDSLWCDHIGIVLSVDDDTLMVAEGNINNQNISGIVQRNRDNTIGYYIRIPENYVSDEFLNIPKNAYFIWGSGKTTTANELARRLGCYVYHTDNSRSRHFQNAKPELHPALCRDVPDIWLLDPEEALRWERDIVREMTPMIIADLTELAAQYKIVICEGDIDVDIIAPLTANIAYITNRGKPYDFFDRPEQRNMLDDIRNRTDLADEEKAKRVQNACAIVSGMQNDEPPREVIQLGVKEIIRDETTTVEQTADAIAVYFGFEI